MRVKSFFKIIILSASMSFLYVALQAQTTGEAFIGQCPGLPAVANLVSAYYGENKAVSEFESKISALHEKLKMETEKVNKAHELAVKSEEERAEKAVAPTLKKLEGKSEEEILALVMSGAIDLASLTENVSGGEGRKSPTEVLEAIEAQKKITGRWAEMDLLSQKEGAEVEAKIKAVSDKYDKLIRAVPMSAPSGETGPTYTATEWAKVEGYQKSERTECYTLWHAHTAKILERIKSRLADVPAYDKYTVTINNQPNLAKTMPSIALILADAYLYTARRVTDLPR